VLIRDQGTSIDLDRVSVPPIISACSPGEQRLPAGGTPPYVRSGRWHVSGHRTPDLCGANCSRGKGAFPLRFRQSVSPGPCVRERFMDHPPHETEFDGALLPPYNLYVYHELIALAGDLLHRYRSVPRLPVCSFERPCTLRAGSGTLLRPLSCCRACAVNYVQ